VIVGLSEAASNAMLDVLAGMMDGGSIQLRAGDDKVLAVLKLSNPAAQVATGGAIEFNPIAEEDAALAEGVAVKACIVTAGGEELLDCDIGDINSDAVVKLHPTRIYRGAPVRLKSFTLAMP